MRQRGFTLIEMLTVMAVLSLLAALLLPVFPQAREQARAAVCLTHVRELGMAFTLYAADWDGRLPCAGDYSRDLDCSWVRVPREYVIEVEAGSLFCYVRDCRPYRCQSDRDTAETVLSYGMNARLSRTAVDSVEQPATVTLLIEEAVDSARGHGTQDGAFYTEFLNDHLATTHFGGGHIVWLDGHVSLSHLLKRRL